jgi:hypothetical protein
MLVMLLPCEVRAEGITGPAEGWLQAGRRRAARPMQHRGTIGGLPRGEIPTTIMPMTLTLTESSIDSPARHVRPVRRRLGRFAVAISVVATILTWTSAPAFAADPSRSSTGPRVAAVDTPTERIRTVDLSRSSAAVTQFTSYWCVPAAVQTMLNLVNGTSDRSYASQSRLYTELRRANKYSYSTRGNDVRGWARVLSAHLPPGQGYADQSFSSRTDAQLAIVKAMDRTGRPVGIVIDAGSHAWTVVGYTVRETPGVADSMTVLGFYVVGPLGSPSDPWPKKYLTTSQFASRFTRYHESTRKVVWEGLYVIVAPTWTIGSVTPTR